MSEPAINLARRFSAMQNNPVSRTRIATLCGVGVMAIVAACAMESPTSVDEVEEVASVEYFQQLVETPARMDTTEMMRVILDGYPKMGDLQLVFPKQSYDERKMLALMEGLAVDYERTFERTQSRDAALEAAMDDIARLEAFVGAPMQVWIGVDRLSIPEREIALPRDRSFEETKAAVIWEAPASMVKGGTFHPKYPDAFKTAEIAGEVLASFVVLEDGSVDRATFTVHRSTHPLFTQSVREALGTARFNPAVVNGRVVKQRLQLPFTFSIK
jgi:TonB family protein